MDKTEILKTLSSSRRLFQEYGVKSIRLFGSYARDEGTPESDVDLLVEFEPSASVGLFEFVRLQQELSDLLGCRVDMATPDSLHKALKQDILKEAIRAA